MVGCSISLPILEAEKRANSVGWFVKTLTRAAGTFFTPMVQGVRNEYFTVTARAAWMLNGMYQAVVIYFGVTWAFHLNADRPDGRLQEMWAQGTVMYTCMVLVVNLQVCVHDAPRQTWALHPHVQATLPRHTSRLALLKDIPTGTDGVTMTAVSPG